MEGAGSLLLGRVTHSDFAGYWPQAAKDPDQTEELRRYARRVDAMEKIVVSTTGDIAAWQNTSRLTRIDAGEIAELKRGDGGDIVIYGSLAVIHSLNRLGLVDEYQLLVHSVALRDGKPLFEPGQPLQRLELVSTTPFASGVVLMTYRPVRD